jgi:thiol-disulfide isomerase/thioredoxin
MKLLKFGAVWCSGCVVMDTRMKEILEDYPEIESPYFDYDQSLNEAKKYDVKRLPTFIFLDQEGKELDRLTGEVKESKMVEYIEKYKGL